ncbi:hypothetical protein F5B20DRAFT_577757 [Whalleya microplaca]|nr:hypothetical protein F5B20DRAFT_577757 [Whalleya microplaca]
MERLPPEITQRILSLVDLDSLTAAKLSCRSIHDAFTGAEKVITTEILRRQIDSSILPEAIAVNKSFGLNPDDVNAVATFTSEHLVARQTPPVLCSLDEALPMRRFHKYVESLAIRLSQDALATIPAPFQTSYHPFRPTPSELFRIQRALYRYQLYCNMFGTRRVEKGEKLARYATYFAQWENEQVACVQNLLLRVIAKPFNEHIDHDISCELVPYIDRDDSWEGWWILSRGLEYIHQLSIAKVFDEYKLLIRDGRGLPAMGYFFFEKFFKTRINWDLIYYRAKSARLLDLPEKYKASVFGKPFYDDPDSGPAIAWEWVYGDEYVKSGSLVASPDTLSFRLWGYVFWDSARLESSAFFRNDFQHSSSVTDLLAVYRETGRNDELND